MKFKLEGKTALVCGGSSGIGLAIAKLLDEHRGINIILVSSNHKKLELAKEGFPSSKYIKTIRCDLSNQKEVEDLILLLQKQKIKVDILINNSGGPKAGDFFQTEISDWQTALQSNFLSHLQITKFCLRNMREKKWGRIINITSTLAVEPTAVMIISAAVRASVSAFSKALSETVAIDGISINTICPGGVETDRLKNLVKDQALATGKKYEDVLKQNTHTIPKGRFAKPNELASLVEYLCCEEAGYLTGRVIAFDGGLLRSF